MLILWYYLIGSKAKSQTTKCNSTFYNRQDANSSTLTPFLSATSRNTNFISKGFFNTQTPPNPTNSRYTHPTKLVETHQTKIEYNDNKHQSRNTLIILQSTKGRPVEQLYTKKKKPKEIYKSPLPYHQTLFRIAYQTRQYKKNITAFKFNTNQSSNL